MEIITELICLVMSTRGANWWTNWLQLVAGEQMSSERRRASHHHARVCIYWECVPDITPLGFNLVLSNPVHALPMMMMRVMGIHSCHLHHGRQTEAPADARTSPGGSCLTSSAKAVRSRGFSEGVNIWGQAWVDAGFMAVPHKAWNLHWQLNGLVLYAAPFRQRPSLMQPPSSLPRQILWSEIKSIMKTVTMRVCWTPNYARKTPGDGLSWARPTAARLLISKVMSILGRVFHLHLGRPEQRP